MFSQRVSNSGCLSKNILPTDTNFALAGKTVIFSEYFGKNRVIIL